VKPKQNIPQSKIPNILLAKMPSSGSTGTGLKHRKINENIKVIGRLCQLTTDYNVTLKLHREKNTFATKSHAYSFVLNH